MAAPRDVKSRLISRLRDKNLKNVFAAALILVHNHPSGSPEPSRADIAITHRIAEAGRLLGIALHDHVIIGHGRHVSLKAKGLI